MFPLPDLSQPPEQAPPLFSSALGPSPSGPAWPAVQQDDPAAVSRRVPPPRGPAEIAELLAAVPRAPEPRAPEPRAPAAGSTSGASPAEEPGARGSVVPLVLTLLLLFLGAAGLIAYFALKTR